ncbi:hypothetical protein OBA47_00820 [bacterium]|nr:hypothetical protein [bacterium]
MFFEQIRKHNPFLNGNKTNSNRKKESERLALEEVSQLISEKKYKRALKVIDANIDNGNATNQILFKKACLLSQVKRYEEANTIWRRLSELKNKPKLAAAAQQHLETTQRIELERIKSTKHLINNLHARAKKYRQTLNNLPKLKDWSTEVDVTPLICEEAALARSADLPKLSFDLTEQSLRAGLESPLLVLDKALSLGMMGQHSTALELLEDLNQGIKNPEIKDRIKEYKDKLNSEADYYNSRKTFFLIVQTRIVTSASSIDTQRMSEDISAYTETEIKSLIFNEATSCLDESPEISLWLANSILDYYPGDGASLQLRGESLAALEREHEAIQSWKKLTDSENKDTATKAYESIAKTLTKMALLTNSSSSPSEAISFFIREHFELKLPPRFNNGLKAILEQLEPSNTDFSDPELEQQQLKLVFNTLVTECLEAQLHKQGRLNATSMDQKPGAIRKTAPKAG